MHLVTMETKDGRFSQRTTITPRQAEILRDLKIKERFKRLAVVEKIPSAISGKAARRKSIAP